MFAGNQTHGFSQIILAQGSLSPLVQGFHELFSAIQLGTEAFPTAHLEPRRDLRECQRCFPLQPRRQGQL